MPLCGAMHPLHRFSKGVGRRSSRSPTLTQPLANSVRAAVFVYVCVATEACGRPLINVCVKCNSVRAGSQGIDRSRSGVPCLLGCIG